MGGFGSPGVLGRVALTARLVLAQRSSTPPNNRLVVPDVWGPGCDYGVFQWSLVVSLGTYHSMETLEGDALVSSLMSDRTDSPILRGVTGPAALLDN